MVQKNTRFRNVSFGFILSFFKQCRQSDNFEGKTIRT